MPHNGVIVSSFDPETELISCDYAWVDGQQLDPAILPPLPLNREGGMQSRVIMSGEPLLQNDVPEQVKDPAASTTTSTARDSCASCRTRGRRACSRR